MKHNHILRKKSGGVAGSQGGAIGVTGEITKLNYVSIWSDL